MSTILCKNYNCPNNIKLEKPISFSFSAIYVPFIDDKCEGKCSTIPQFNNFYDIEKDFVYEGAECGLTISYMQGCHRLDCVHNENTKCTRPEILVDIFQGRWACKCFAFRKIRGHIDWFGLLKPDGTAKGGHVDDEYAQKINKYAKTTRSYRSHMKQSST